MPEGIAQEAGTDVISDLINRARLAGKDTQRRDSIEAQAASLGVSPSLLLILEQMQKAFEDEAERKKQDTKDNAIIAVSARALSNNDFGVKPENQGWGGLLASTLKLNDALKGVSNKVKDTFFKSRGDFINTLQSRSVDERKTLDKVVSGDHILEKDIDRMKSLVQDPTIVKQSESVVDNSRAVVKEILTKPGATKITPFTQASTVQQAKVNIVNNDPAVLQAARLQGVKMREAVYKVEAMNKAMDALKKADKKEVVQDTKYLEEMQANIKLEKDWQVRDQVQSELLKPKALRKVEMKEQQFDLKAMHEAAKTEKQHMMMEQELLSRANEAMEGKTPTKSGVDNSSLARPIQEKIQDTKEIENIRNDKAPPKKGDTFVHMVQNVHASLRDEGHKLPPRGGGKI